MGDFRTFEVNAIYSTEQAAQIMQLHPKTVRDICRRGQMRCQMMRGGYRITGWAIRDFIEGRCVLSEN